MIHFVRHLPADAAGLCYGWQDVTLTADSVAAMSALADRLAELAPSAIVASDLVRCRLLAEAVAERCGLPLRLDAHWRERHFGHWEGRAWDAIHAEDPAVIGRLMAADFAPPEGESLTLLQARVRRALGDVRAGALVVAHGGPIAVARCLIEGYALGEAARLIPAPGEVVSL